MVSTLTARATASGRGVQWVLLAATLWGTVGIASQALYQQGITIPLTVNLFRMGIAALILSAASLALIGRRTLNIRRSDLLLMIFGGGMMAASQSLYLAAISRAGVTIATLITICLSPLIVALFSALLTRERPTRRMLIALAAALIGTLLLLNAGAEAQSAAELPSGILLALGAAGCYAGVILSARGVANRCHPLQTTAVSFLAGALLLLIVSLPVGFSAPAQPVSWLLLIYLGVVPGALAYGLFHVGIRSLTATAASILTLMEPLTAALLAWLLFGEWLGVIGLLGAALLLGSFALLASGE